MGGEACAGRTCLVPLWGLGEKIVVFCSPHAPVILSDIAILRQNSDKPGHTGHKRATQWEEGHYRSTGVPPWRLNLWRQNLGSTNCSCSCLVYGNSLIILQQNWQGFFEFTISKLYRPIQQFLLELRILCWFWILKSVAPGQLLHRFYCWSLWCSS